ncbi:MAG: transposase, partial [Oscillospiraceae bacterium]|nr:transposase [Oscillospiraceae bacterium]
MPYIKGENRNQLTLFPTNLDEYVQEDSYVRVIDAFVDSLNMETLNFKRHIASSDGRPGYDPRDMLKLYIYGYYNKIRSSRKLQ